MSVENNVLAAQRLSIPEIRARKGQVPLVCLTAYSYPMAKMLDPLVDIILVGDSLGMVLYGMPSTLGVTLEMMIAHGKAVTKGASRSLVVVDMPFASYQESPEQAFRNAARIMAETNCAAVKLEGGSEMAETVAFLTARGVPVLGHVGLLPQSVNQLGGYKARGRSEQEATSIMKAALDFAEAGAFALVLEGVMEDVANDITAQTPVPIIGIGASAACDGQILVSEDMLGLFQGFKPRFVRRYADLAREAERAVEQYAKDVKNRQFPDSEHVFRKKKAS
ncbi:MAG: 3-methyl-2-oxobutanoate hydroxymethyltransferase [Alphaproteobacteria bacterium]